MDRVIVKIRAKSLNPAEQEELSFTLVSRGTIQDRLSAVELELSQYVRVRELNGHWEGVMPVVLSDHSSQSHDVDDFKRMVSFLRNKGYAGRSQMESKSVYLSPSDAVDENGFTILKLKFRKVPSFLDRPMRQLSKRHSDPDGRRRSSETYNNISQTSISEGDHMRRASESSLAPSLQSIAQNGSQISSLAQSLLPKRTEPEPVPATPGDDWTISKVTAGSTTMDLQSSLLPAKTSAPETLATPPASPLTPDTTKEHRAIDRFDRPAFKYSLLVSMADRHSAWVFGAIAELIDNSVDAGATQVEIGITHSFCCESHPGPALFIQDNGQGMTHREMQAMMEFGHDYVPQHTQGAERIGQYGVGFKSSAMRLGQSSLVFSHSKKEQTFSLGFLSLPYNRGRSSVSVPVLTFHADSFQPQDAYSSSQDVENALHDVTIQTGMNPIAIGSEFQRLKALGASGTKILLFDLHRDDQKLDFTTDQDDIRISAPQSGQTGSQAPFLRNSRRHIATDVPPDYSLTTYCSILFLQPRIKILIRGCAVTSSPVADRMQNQKRKTFSVEEPGRGDPFSGPSEGEGAEKYVALVGFSPEDKERALGGFMLYYRNRLILSYHRVGIQTKNLDLANGVVGVVDTRSLPVLNTKQDFNQNSRHFVSLERHLSEIVEHYYWNFVNPDVKVTPLPTPVRTVDESFWLQCNHCTKWRRVKSWDPSKPIPKFWFCRMNPDPSFNSCLVPEESQGRSEVTTGVTSGAQINTNGSNSNPNSKFSAFQSFSPAAKENSSFKNSYPHAHPPESHKFAPKRRKT